MPRDWRGLAWLAGVFAVALAVRLIVLSELSRLALFRTPQLDSLEYLSWARSIASGELRWPVLPTHAPGYPFFLGGLLALFNGSVTVARIVQAVLGAVLCVVVALLGKRLFGPRAGIAAGLLLALYAPLAYIEVSLLAEGVFVLLLVLALASLLSPWRDTRPIPTAAVAGALLGLAALMRATALALVPALLLVLLLDRRWGDTRRRGLAAAAMVAACLVLVVPVTIKVSRVAGSFVPLQAFGGLNFYMGNDPTGNGTPGARVGGDWDRLQAEPLRQGLSAADQERWFSRKAWQAIGRDPLGWLGVLGKKMVWLIQDDEIRESHSFHFFARQAPLLRWLPGFGLLFPLAVLGLWTAWTSARDRKLPAVLAVYLLVMAASCVLIVVASRYRIPLVPVLALFAGAAVLALWDLLREKRYRDLAPFAAVLVVAWLAGHLWNHAPSRDFTEEWVMTGQSLENEGRIDEAETAYREALSGNPRSALALNGLGKIRVRRGDTAGAEEAFNTATRLDPGYARSYYNLGMTYLAEHDADRAIPAFRKAVELSPDHVSALAELGTLLVERNQVDEAGRVLRRAVALDPGNPAANLGLARIEGAARRPEQGLPYAKRAVEGLPDDAEAWLTLSMLAVEAKDIPTAEQAIARLEQIVGRDAPPVALERALLARLQGRRDDTDRELRALLTRNPRFEPAVRLFLLNAAEQGRRAEAEEFLRGVWGR